jgi:hypothetical protein
MLRALCAALGVAFTEDMLSWPAGPRDTDGVWGRYWYAGVWRSTGFGRYQPRAQPLPPRLAALADRCRPHYETLYAHRLAPLPDPGPPAGAAAAPGRPAGAAAAPEFRREP